MGIWGGIPNPKENTRVAGHLRTLSVGLICFGLLSAGMGMGSAYPVYLGLMTGYGVALTMVQTGAASILQESANRQMQGRIQGLMGAVYAGALPLGMAIFGPLADFLPLQGIMMLCGVGLVISGLYVKTWL